LGGWQLNADTEYLYFDTHIDDDWDEVTNATVSIYFEINAAGTAPSDTVDISLVLYLKGLGESVSKNQTVEVATTVGEASQYTLFSARIPLSSLGVNGFEVYDILSFRLNLETDTSEVDDITICYTEIKYSTTKPALEN